MAQQHQELPPSTAGTVFNLMGKGTIRLYRYMKCHDIETYTPLYKVNMMQFKSLASDKINNKYLALMTHYHVQDQKGDEDFGHVFKLGFEFPDELQPIKKSPFVSLTLHPWLALTGGALDSLIVGNDCLVELEVPLSYLMPTTDAISLREGELLLLLPPGVKFSDLVVKVRKNGIYGQKRQPGVARRHLKDTYGIKGGLVEYKGGEFRWNWIFDHRGGGKTTQGHKMTQGRKNPWNEFLKSQKGSGYSIKELQSIYVNQ